MMVIAMHMTRDPWWRLRVVIRMDSSSLYPVSMPQRLEYSSTSMSGSFVANEMYFSHGSSSVHPSASLFLRPAAPWGYRHGVRALLPVRGGGGGGDHRVRDAATPAGLEVGQGPLAYTCWDTVLST